jgi:hypothetical protein
MHQRQGLIIFRPIRYPIFGFFHWIAVCHCFKCCFLNSDTRTFLLFMHQRLCEAVSRPNMRFVAIKTVAQQDVQAVHRIRSE